jgi:hypothetical protein
VTHRARGATLVTLCSLLIASGVIATLLALEPDDQWLVLILVWLLPLSGGVWWLVSGRLAPGGSPRERRHIVLWGVLAFAAWILVPLGLAIVFVVPAASSAAAGAGQGSGSTAARILFVTGALLGGGAASWACAWRLLGPPYGSDQGRAR